MKPCKSHQRAIALLAAQALNENETPPVLEHLRECAACRAYAKELESVISLYARDAERAIAMPGLGARLFVARPVPWYKRPFASPPPAIGALAALVVCAAVIFLSNRPGRNHPQPLQTAVATSARTATMTPSIGNLRRLNGAELEELTRPERAWSFPGPDFVFSVRTRDDGS